MMLRRGHANIQRTGVPASVGLDHGLGSCLNGLTVDMLGRIRTYCRDLLFRVLDRALDADDGRDRLQSVLRPVLDWKPRDLSQHDLKDIYPEIGQRVESPSPRRPVFVTSRFRSGSTLLWNAFRQLDGATAFYEPFNERRWFDASARGDRVDQTHQNVTDYWREYAGLEKLAEFYSERWIDRDLFMNADAWAPQMRHFIQTVIASTSDRPVMQFNRIDLRLPWLRRNFPNAAIVHLFRHPRDQWFSTFLGDKAFSCDGSPCDFLPHDQFYLLVWARDLKRQFPFLDEKFVDHPYQLSYYIWKLSYLYGRQYADHSIQFERLVESPKQELGQLFESLEFPCDDIDQVCSVVAKPTIGKWREYAEDAWFERHETHCESVLADFIGGQEIVRNAGQ